MASLGNALVSKILGHSDAEKAFRPWWDNLEDFLVYGLVMLGIIVAPTAIINGTPLDCNFCQQDHCLGKFPDDNNTTPTENPNFNAWWVKKYCTMTAVDGFIMYFPYILLIMALVIVLTERVFVRIFRAGLKLDMFYNLLVKDIFESSGEDSANPASTGAKNEGFFDLEHTKTALEVSHSFSSTGSNYYWSYLLRTAIELVLAGLLLFWLLWDGLPIIQMEEFIYCSVHGYHFECAGHPQQFYMYVLFIVVAILIVYLFCCTFNLLWLLVPGMSVLGRLMRAYKRELRKKSKPVLSDREMLGEIYNLYYRNRDLRLLLNLLAESSGIAPSLRVISLFDKAFRTNLQPSNLKVAVTKGEKCCKVEFDDPPTMKEIFANIEQVACIYTVEILPPTPASSVAVFKYGEAEEEKLMPIVTEGGDTEMQLLTRHGPKCTEFQGLDSCQEYTIRVCTVINGKAIARKVERIKPDRDEQ